MRWHHLLLFAAALPADVMAAPPESLSAGHAGQVLAGLAIVLGLIAAASWAARRVQTLRPTGRGHIRIVEGLAVGTRDKLLLVDVDGQRVLIGLTPGRMQTLATLTSGADADAFSATLAANTPAATT